VSVCLLPVPVSTLSCTPFHGSPTINSQRFALFDSTFSVRFKPRSGSHYLSAPSPSPQRRRRAHLSRVRLPPAAAGCRRLPPSAAGAPGACVNSWLLRGCSRARGVKRWDVCARELKWLRSHSKRRAEMPRIEGGKLSSQELGPTGRRWPGLECALGRRCVRDRLLLALTHASWRCGQLGTVATTRSRPGRVAPGPLPRCCATRTRTRVCAGVRPCGGSPALLRVIAGPPRPPRRGPA